MESFLASVIPSFGGSQLLLPAPPGLPYTRRQGRGARAQVARVCSATGDVTGKRRWDWLEDPGRRDIPALRGFWGTGKGGLVSCSDPGPCSPLNLRPHPPARLPGTSGLLLAGAPHCPSRPCTPTLAHCTPAGKAAARPGHPSRAFPGPACPRGSRPRRCCLRETGPATGSGFPKALTCTC